MSYDVSAMMWVWPEASTWHSVHWWILLVKESSLKMGLSFAFLKSNVDLVMESDHLSCSDGDDGDHQTIASHLTYLLIDHLSERMRKSASV